jgi:quercetin 2,3-dioxygenase
MKINKTISKINVLGFKPAFPGLKGVDLFAHQYPIEPVLVFTEYYMDRPVFGPHPHAGISVMTYLLPDSKGHFINRDSLGDFSIIEPGGIHVSQAGIGMQHDEFPETTGVETHGFQIWINHADKDRMVSPKAMHAKTAGVPEIVNEKYKVRIIHGSFQSISAPFTMVTPITMLHIYLQANQSISLDTNTMAFAYVLNGEGTIDNQTILPQQLINFSTEGNQIILSATESDLEFMFATAEPINEPITYGGPFVMTTEAQMAETKRRYGRGEMGELLPYKK